MVNDIKAVGAVRLEYVNIHSLSDSGKVIDIKKFATQITIVESMDIGRISGSIIVAEPANLINKFPLKGEEYLEISYTDYYDVNRIEQLFIYGISDVEYLHEGNSLLRYKLSFVSASTMLSEDNTIRKTYRPEVGNSGRVSDYVDEVYREYYQEPASQFGINPKPITIQPTTGTKSYVIPGYNPENTMYFFSRKAFDVGDSNQGFRFFESRNRYGFMTNEYASGPGNLTVGYGNGMIDPGLARAAGITEKSIPIYYMGFQNRNMPHDQNILMRNIISMKYNDRVNSVNDIRGGFYNRTTWEIDIVNGILTPSSYLYDKGVHTSDFKDTFIKTPKETYVLADYSIINDLDGPAMRDNQNYAETYNNKIIDLYHFRKGIISFRIHGNNNTFAGSVIGIELTDPNGEINKEKSGRFLLNTVTNMIENGMYMQDVSASKVGEL